ncbi:MAG TPA: signal peptidase I [Geobacteraceae bacterium]
MKLPGAKPIKKYWRRSRLKEYAETLAWALFLAFLIRTFVVQAFVIPSGSMENTLLIGDRLLVNKFIYGIKVPFTDRRILKLRAPERGDVIVFEFPPDRSKDFIKRVVGVPGDVVMIRNKQVHVNGIPYHDPHELHKDAEVLPAARSPRDNFGPVRVPAGDFFVMGDNRDRSYDSRFWGFVTYPEIVGRAFIIYWSWDKDFWRVRWREIGRVIK